MFVLRVTFEIISRLLIDFLVNCSETSHSTTNTYASKRPQLKTIDYVLLTVEKEHDMIHSTNK